VLYNSKMPHRAFIRLFWLSLFALTASPVLAQKPPQRVVSLNLCADQLLQSLADPSQIAGLSPLARDPSLSLFAKEADSLPVLSPKGETLFLVKPDLVLLAPYEHGLLRERLTRDKIEVFMLPSWTSLEEGETQIRALAQRLGQKARGDQLILEITHALQNSQAKALDRTKPVLEIERRLYTPGHTSLIAAFLARWHMPNLADDLGLSRGGFVALEKLVLLKPERLVISNGQEAGSHAPDDMGLALLRHPALQATSVKTITLPARLTLCGGPATPMLIEALSSALQ
jgi:iron complex transport system substrate-binding protein